jgi:hypothetical protein
MNNNIEKGKNKMEVEPRSERSENSSIIGNLNIFKRTLDKEEELITAIERKLLDIDGQVPPPINAVKDEPTCMIDFFTTCNHLHIINCERLDEICNRLNNI